MIFSVKQTVLKMDLDIAAVPGEDRWEGRTKFNKCI